MIMTDWSYSLTTYDEAIAAQTGYLRQKPMLGQPWRNTNYAEGDLYEMWQHGLAAGAEIALARMIGLRDFVPSVNVYKDELDIPGYCEVRYTQNNEPKLRLTKSDNLEHIYVLMSEGIKNRTRRLAPDYVGPPYKALGWSYGTDCLKKEFRYNQNTLYVPVRYLNDMDTAPWIS